jgi:periplasmic protein TonB
VFDEVTQRARGTGGARRARFVLAAAVLQALLLAGVAAASAALRARAVEERLVPVTFVRTAPPPAPAPSNPAAAPGAPMPAARPRPARPPRKDAPPAPPPAPLVQPKDVPDQLTLDPALPPEPEAGPGAGEGTVGGAVGGGGGAPVPGAAAAAGGGGPAHAIEDAPADAALRNLAPRAADPSCVRRKLDRSPGLLAGTRLVVQFLVGPDGGVRDFKVTSGDADAGVKQAIWSVIRACRWTPGTDAEGKPAAAVKTQTIIVE